MSFDDLKIIIDFIYRGEIVIPKNQISSIIKSAENLKVTGLFSLNESNVIIVDNNRSSPLIKGSSGEHVQTTSATSPHDLFIHEKSNNSGIKREKGDVGNYQTIGVNNANASHHHSGSNYSPSSHHHHHHHHSPPPPGKSSSPTNHNVMTKDVTKTSPSHDIPTLSLQSVNHHVPHDMSSCDKTNSVNDSMRSNPNGSSCPALPKLIPIVSTGISPVKNLSEPVTVSIPHQTDHMTSTSGSNLSHDVHHTSPPIISPENALMISQSNNNSNTSSHNGRVSSPSIELLSPPSPPASDPNEVDTQTSHLRQHRYDDYASQDIRKINNDSQSLHHNLDSKSINDEQKAFNGILVRSSDDHEMRDVSHHQHHHHQDPNDEEIDVEDDDDTGDGRMIVCIPEENDSNRSRDDRSEKDYGEDDDERVMDLTLCSASITNNPLTEPNMSQHNIISSQHHISSTQSSSSPSPSPKNDLLASALLSGHVKRLSGQPKARDFFANGGCNSTTPSASGSNISSTGGSNFPEPQMNIIKNPVQNIRKSTSPQGFTSTNINSSSNYSQLQQSPSPPSQHQSIREQVARLAASSLAATGLSSLYDTRKSSGGDQMSPLDIFRQQVHQVQQDHQNYLNHLSSESSIPLKRGRGRPPRHSVDAPDENIIRSTSSSHGSIGEPDMSGFRNILPANHSNNSTQRDTSGSTSSGLSTGSSTYMISDPIHPMLRRIRLTAEGTATSLRGRKPKSISYSGSNGGSSSRDASGKNKCPHCPQVYYSTQAMNDHVNNVHSKNSHKYSCKICSKEFSWKISLNKHLRKLHGEEPRSNSSSSSANSNTISSSTRYSHHNSSKHHLTSALHHPSHHHPIDPYAYN